MTVGHTRAYGLLGLVPDQFIYYGNGLYSQPIRWLLSVSRQEVRGVKLIFCTHGKVGGWWLLHI